MKRKADGNERGKDNVENKTEPQNKKRARTSYLNEQLFILE